MQICANFIIFAQIFSLMDNPSKKARPKFVKALWITLIAVGLSMVMAAPFTATTGAAFSTSEQSDYSITDFYNYVANNRALSYLDDNIVIVNIDRSDRYEIAEILNLLTLLGPKGVGLDVTFEDVREGDSVLLDAIFSTPNIIQPVSLQPIAGTDSFYVEGASYFFDPEHPEGYSGSGLPSKYHNSMVREMKTNFPTRGVGDIPSFSVALAEIADPDAVARLKKRDKDLEVISYYSRRFRIYEPDEIVDNADEFTGRLVLIGAMSERGDLHPTPIETLTPGVVIHAHAAAAILGGKYLNTIPHWLELALSALLCYGIVLLNVSWDSKGRTFWMRLIQVGCVLILVYGGYSLFINRNLSVNVTAGLLMITFGLFACDIYTGIEGMIKERKERREKKRLENQKNNL